MSESHGTDATLRYLTNGEIREQIAYTAGGDPTRYGADSDRGLCKADMLRIAEQVRPDGDETVLEDCTLSELLKLVCVWSGGEYRGNAGQQWGVQRENLKKIHRTLGASDPREVAA